MILIQTTKSRLLFKAGSPFASASEADKIQVEFFVKKGYILLSAIFLKIVQQAKDAVAEVIGKDEEGKEKVITTYEPAIQEDVKQTCFVEYAITPTNFKTFSLLDAHNEVMKQMKEDCESGFEFESTIKL